MQKPKPEHYNIDALDQQATLAQKAMSALAPKSWKDTPAEGYEDARTNYLELSKRLHEASLGHSYDFGVYKKYEIRLSHIGQKTTYGYAINEFAQVAELITDVNIYDFIMPPNYADLVSSHLSSGCAAIALPFLVQAYGNDPLPIEKTVAVTTASLLGFEFLQANIADDKVDVGDCCAIAVGAGLAIAVLSRKMPWNKSLKTVRDDGIEPPANL